MFSLKYLMVFVTLALSISIQAQTFNMYETKKDIVVDGSENPDLSNAEIIVKNIVDRINPVHADFFTYNFHNITNRQTGYDLQSNASTQQVWLDLNNPDFLHAIFTNSQQPTVWSDRTCIYFGSVDGGVTWYELGQVPFNNGSTGRSGFPAIHGTSNGRAVITNHNNSNGTTTHTKIFVDNSPFEYNFMEYDPGDVTQGFPIWPRLTVNQSNDVVFVSSVNLTPDYAYINYLDLPGGTFFGYNEYTGTTAEQYSLAVSEGGKIGLAFNGSADDNNDGDVFYQESSDGGITWSLPVRIFDRPDFLDTTLGAIRGVSCSFYGEQPSVVFEICQQIFSAGNFFPTLPSEIHFWSPNVNGGFSFAIADTFNVPFYPYLGTNDVQVPVCRPVIGRSEEGNFLFVAFIAATENVWPDPPDPTTYCAGYFMLSSDGGNSWSTPEKFTPTSPLLDWRYVSIAPINPVDAGLCTVHMVIQGDTIPGSTINAAGMPVGVTAQYYHVSTEPIVIPVELVSFTAEFEEHNVLLRWQTSTETNNQGFEIERKLENANWEGIGFIEGNGTTTEAQLYSYYDDVSEINAKSFSYRLKQIDFNGSYEYSDEVIVENSFLPTVLQLYQNYPNPFNPNTKIKYSVPEKSLVTLKVYDIIGNEVATLINEEKTAGHYDVTFNAADYVSGVYIYTIKAGNAIETKKMILMK